MWCCSLRAQNLRDLTGLDTAFLPTLPADAKTSRLGQMLRRFRIRRDTEPLDVDEKKVLPRHDYSVGSARLLGFYLSGIIRLAQVVD